MASENRPTTGSPIVSEKTGEVLGWWTDQAPSFPTYGYLRWTFLPLQGLLRTLPADAVEQTELSFFSVWKAYGRFGGGTQVWETTAERPEDLRGLRGVRMGDHPTKDRDLIAARAIRDLSAHPIFSSIHPSEADYLRGFSRYMLETADDL